MNEISATGYAFGSPSNKNCWSSRLIHALFLYFSVCFKLDDKAKEESVTTVKFESICSEEFGQLSQMLTVVRSKQNVSKVILAGGSSSSKLQWFKRALEKMGNFYAS